MLRTVLVVSALLFAVGCGKSTCDRADEVNDALAEKASSCPGVKAGGHVPGDICNQGIAKCTDADLTALQGHFDCLEKVPTCTPGKESDFDVAVRACEPGVSHVTAECLAAVSPEKE